MSSYDKVKMILPDGTTFVGRGDLRVTEIHRQNWMFNGGQNIAAAAERVAGSNASVKAQPYLGSGAGQRIIRIEFAQWEGSSDQWGSASAGDDVLTKLQTLGHDLANTVIDSNSTATLEVGEYSSVSGAKYSALDVVPGEVELPGLLDEEPSSFSPRIDWLEALDTADTLHSLP